MTISLKPFLSGLGLVFLSLQGCVATTSVSNERRVVSGDVSSARHDTQDELTEDDYLRAKHQKGDALVQMCTSTPAFGYSYEECGCGLAALKNEASIDDVETIDRTLTEMFVLLGQGENEDKALRKAVEMEATRTSQQTADMANVLNDITYLYENKVTACAPS